MKSFFFWEYLLALVGVWRDLALNQSERPFQHTVRNTLPCCEFWGWDMFQRLRVLRSMRRAKGELLKEQLCPVCFFCSCEILPGPFQKSMGF